MTVHRPDKRFDDLCRTAFSLEEIDDIEGAIECYRVAALVGEPVAQTNLALLLDTKAKPPRRGEAVYWHKRAVRSGSSLAAWNLAVRHLARGRMGSYGHWMGIAARLGDDDARRQLLAPTPGTLGFRGFGLVDRETAGPALPQKL